MVANVLGIDGHHNALTAKPFRRLAHELRPIDGTGIDGNLIGARVEELTNIVELVDAAADGKWHEDLIGGSRHDIQNDLAIFVGCGDVEETKLVGALPIVKLRDFHRVSGVSQFQEFNSFDDASGFHVEARNDAFSQHKNKHV